MKLDREFLFYAFGAGTEWTAICVDLDLAVQAESQQEVIEKMREVFATYVEDAMQEEPAVRDKLLHRPSPLRVRLALWFQYQKFLLRRSRPHEKSVSTLALPCPA